jgi:Metallo-peptidase family M12B Reprolysin-like
VLGGVRERRNVGQRAAELIVNAAGAVLVVTGGMLAVSGIVYSLWGVAQTFSWARQKNKQLQQQLREEKQFLQSVRLIPPVMSNSSLARIDLLFRATPAAVAHFELAGNTTLDLLLVPFQDYLHLVFYNTFAPFGNSGNFGMLTAPPANTQEREAATAAIFGPNTVAAMMNNYTLAAESNAVGADLVVYIVHYEIGDKRSYTCSGGCAYVRTDSLKRPIAIVDDQCLLKQHFSTVVHEIGHQMGLDHDPIPLNTQLQLPLDEYGISALPPPGYGNGFKLCLKKGKVSKVVRDIMSYPCSFESGIHYDDDKPEPVFSCANITVKGVVMGNVASSSNLHASNACFYLYEHWASIAANAELFDDIDKIRRTDS